MQKRMFLEDERPMVLRVFEVLVQIAAVCALALFVARFLFYSVETKSRAMEPTIQPESVVFVNRAAYVFTEPDRFDVVTFRRAEESSESLTRRIIGMPGETVKIEKGVVYINDRELDISDYASEITSDGIARSGIRLQENEYFVLGDMPANAEDSRSSTIGTVTRKKIIGKSWMYGTSLTELHLIR